MIAYAFNATGQIELPGNEQLAQDDALTAIIAYTSGTMVDGAPYYAYVAIKPSLYQEFYARTVAGEPLVIYDYGTLIAGDFQAAPPPDVVEAMRLDYGFDTNFEDGLLQQLEKQRSAHTAKKESERLLSIAAKMKKQE